MTKQLFIYEHAAPISPTRHSDTSVEVGEDYAFARDINAVPIVVGEFAHIAREYPIVFAETDGKLMPFALVGLRDNENLYVGQDGSWDATYIPAFIRRYPFVFHHRSGTDEFVLCIDEAYTGVNKDGRGRALFEDENQPSDYLKRIMAFTTTYQREALLTQRFGERLMEIGIHGAAQVKFEVQDHATAITRGMMAVDRERFGQLGADQLGDLLRSGDLERIYMHLFSLANFDHLGRRLQRLIGTTSA